MRSEFLERLGALMKEYKADICWECDEGSDTYGVTGMKMAIDWQEDGNSHEVSVIGSGIDGYNVHESSDAFTNNNKVT